MLFSGTHKDIGPSLESIGAAFAIFEMKAGTGDAVLASANTLFEEISARPVAECVGRALSEIAPRYVEKPIRECLLRCLKEQCPQEDELVVEREGASRWWRLVASPVVPTQAGHGPRVISTLIEITEKRQLQQQLEITRQRFEAVVQTAYDGVISIDEKQTIKLMNESAKYIFGVNGEKVIGSNLSRFIPQRFRVKHPDYVGSFRNSSVDARPMESRVPVRGLRADGSEFPVEVTISKIKVGGAIEMTAVIRDISERVRLIEELSRAASNDPLTGAFNRRHGLAVLKSELARCTRFGHSISLVMIDLDHFKQINDSYGHACGDSVLKAVVETVGLTLRETDILCRWGGEEFLILLPETSGEEALSFAERARQAVAEKPVAGCDEQAVAVTASFGVAALVEEATTPEQFIGRADKALYRAKEEGRNRVVLDR
jgi:diguanylate cyclase (GGDEF)-like protein/PAS domain S-box-containing protein